MRTKYLLLTFPLIGLLGCWSFTSSADGQSPGETQEQQAAEPAQHPLVPALEAAYKCRDHFAQNIRDYTCTMVKRERLNDKLAEHEYMFVKIRHEPMSVYMYFLGPEAVKGREVIYYPAANNENLIAHEGSGLKAKFGAVSLKPTSMLAMQGNRYPISEIGMANLAKRLIEVGEVDKQYGECDVKFFKGAKVSGRTATCVQVMHPVPRREFRYHMARVFIDDEFNVPIRFEAYDWPQEQGGPPVLLEEYTYLNLKFNNGFTDGDFDTQNPNYSFK